MSKRRIAIFVSGEGTNCENIIRYFYGRNSVEVSIVVSSNADAGAIVRARRYGVPTAVITRCDFRDNPQAVLDAVSGCDLIVLAGFLLLIPAYLIERFPRRIVNIHPSLLPKFGGKGMWGHHVHEAVKMAGETVSGITIHYVDAVYDEGEHIASYSTALSPDDTSADIAAKVRVLEMDYYPQIIEKVVLQLDK